MHIDSKHIPKRRTPNICHEQLIQTHRTKPNHQTKSSIQIELPNNRPISLLSHSACATSLEQSWGICYVGNFFVVDTIVVNASLVV